MISTLVILCNIESDSDKVIIGDAIIKIIRLNTFCVPFSDYNFIRLFLAYCRLMGKWLLIERV